MCRSRIGCLTPRETRNNTDCHPADRNASIYPNSQPPVTRSQKSSRESPIRSRKSSITFPQSSSATVPRQLLLRVCSVGKTETCSLRSLVRSSAHPNNFGVKEKIIQPLYLRGLLFPIRGTLRVFALDSPSCIANHLCFVANHAYIYP